MYNGQQPISIWLSALGTQQISHLTFYFHMSPWCPDYCGEKTNEINRISAPKRFTIKTEWQGDRKSTANKGDCSPDMGDMCWVHFLVTQGQETNSSEAQVPYLCVPSISLPQRQATHQAMAQHGARAKGRCYWDHPLALQAGTYPFKSISHLTPAPCFPPHPREWAATLPARLEGSTRITWTLNL